MPPLHPAATTPAATYRDIEAAHPSAPDNLLLMLRFVAVKLHNASHRPGPACGQGVRGGLWFCRGNVVRLGALRLAGLLPTLGAIA